MRRRELIDDETKRSQELHSSGGLLEINITENVECLHLGKGR